MGGGLQWPDCVVTVVTVVTANLIYYSCGQPRLTGLSPCSGVLWCYQHSLAAITTHVAWTSMHCGPQHCVNSGRELTLASEKSASLTFRGVTYSDTYQYILYTLLSYLLTLTIRAILAPLPSHIYYECVITAPQPEPERVKANICSVPKRLFFLQIKTRRKLRPTKEPHF